jgi:hypothetical protein
MTKQRGGFLRGKRWVGIAAVNITNLSLKQKNQMFDIPKFKLNSNLIKQKLKENSIKP